MFVQTCLGVEDIKSLLCLIEQLSVALLSTSLTGNKYSSVDSSAIVVWIKQNSILWKLSKGNLGSLIIKFNIDEYI